MPLLRRPVPAPVQAAAVARVHGLLPPRTGWTLPPSPSRDDVETAPGMLADEPTIEAVVEALELVAGAPVVVDPVMVSESGATLLDPGAKAALIERPELVAVRAEMAREHLGHLG